MDYAACHVVYVDRTAGEDRLFGRGEEALEIESGVDGLHLVGDHTSPKEQLLKNVGTLLKTFSEGELRCANRLAGIDANATQSTYAQQETHV